MLYFLDTNIVSYILEGRQNVLDKFMHCASCNQIKIPDIVYYEIKRGLLYNDSKKQLPVFEKFCSVYGIAQISFSVIQRAAENYASLKRKGILIEDADILIGSSAVENNAILVTNNTKHLQRIKDIKTEEWPL